MNPPSAPAAAPAASNPTPPEPTAPTSASLTATPRRTHPPARTNHEHHHRARRAGPVRRRHPGPRLLAPEAHPDRRRHRLRQVRRPQRHPCRPGRLSRRRPLGHRPQERHGTPTLDTLPRPPRHHPGRSHRPTGRRCRRPRGPSRAARRRRRARLEPEPNRPALVFVVDEYAELTDNAPAALNHADSIARRGRAPAVTLIVGTQRPTQKTMGSGALRGKWPSASASESRNAATSN